MYEIDIAGLEKLMQAGHAAEEYAWNHYDELIARKHSYTLYGPNSYGIGASIPGKIVPRNARKLTKKTRRKDYTVYELDEDFKVLRTIAVLDYTKIDVTFHHFEMNGVTYAVPFYGNQKEMGGSDTFALQFADNRPIYCGIIGGRSIAAQFYEYQSDSKMIVTSYGYWPVSKFSRHGYPVDPSAPIGSLNSPADRGVSEESIEYIEFSRWFE